MIKNDDFVLPIKGYVLDVDLVGGFEEGKSGGVFGFRHVLGGETVEFFFTHHAAAVVQCLKKFGLWDG